MSDDPDAFSRLTASIDGGESIDWDEAIAAAPDEHVRRLIEHLRIVASVADVHRSQIDDSAVDANAVAPSDGTAATLGRWGHLALVKKIGEGAYGEVYEAIDTWLDHRRALKLLKPTVAGPMSAHPILHEARKLVRVRHPNVVTVHGADKHDGRVGFWMDLIEGQTLQERVKLGRLSAGEATYIGRELCSALAAVHQADLIHRDVKAQNVMRASDGGRIILMDFGAGEFRGVPNERPAQGTPLYLAPELLAGDAASVQSDVYALGTLLFYLVTGGFPVEGRSVREIIDAHDRNRRRHLRDARPDLPESFVGVVQRALDPDPAQRFATAGDFHEALRGDSIAVSDTTRSLRAPAPVPATDPVRRLGFAVLGAVTLFAIVEVLGFIASRTFEVAFHVDADFTAGPGDYFRLGREGLLPFVVLWLGGGLAAAMWSAAWQFVGRRWPGVAGPLASRIDAAPPVKLAAWTAITAATTAAVVTWLTYRSLFLAIVALRDAHADSVPDVSVIGQAFQLAFYRYSNLSALLSFILLLAIMRWFPALERRTNDPTVTRVKWMTAAITVFVVVLAVAPRRIAVDQFEVVEYGSRPWFVIGTRGDELLLYPADRIVTAGQRIRQGDSGLVRTSMTRRLVDR